MKITLSVSRKDGRPGYGSEGCSCQCEVELSEATVSENPLSLHDEARRILAYCDAVVTEQLAKTSGQVEAQPPARAGLPSQARPASTPTPDRPTPAGQYSPTHGPDGAARWKQNGRPKCGRELVPYARRAEEEGRAPGLFKRLVAFGRSQEGWPDRMVEWTGQMVSAALYSVLGEGYDDDPEPEPVHNGHAGNGNGYFNGHGNGRGAY